VDKYPPPLEKKITLLKYFRSYMNEHLIKTGANIPIREGDELARLPCLNTWFRTKSAIVLHLSNGTLQINFFYVSPWDCLDKKLLKANMNGNGLNVLFIRIIPS
jgi:hypothetical protein